MANDKFLCDCGASHLEELARTKLGRGLAWKTGIRQTAYFLCEGCNCIYKSTRYGEADANKINLEPLEISLGDFSHLSAYTGELTWEQIMAFAPSCSGEITRDNEWGIIEPRPKKSRP